MLKFLKVENKPSLVYHGVKFFAQIFLLWPIDKNRSYFDRNLREIFWWILIVNGFFLIIGLIMGTYYFIDEIGTFTTLIFIVFEIVVIAENMFTSIIFKIKKPGFQILLSLLDESLNNVNCPEEILFKEYLQESAVLSIGIYTIYNSVACGFVYLQIFKSNLILPKEIWYPFSVSPYYKKILVLIQQFMYIIHTAVIHLADSIFFMMLHLARAKLSLVNNKIKQVVDESQLKKCIQEHQEAIWFIKEINNTSSFIIFKTVVATAFYLTLGYLQLLHKHETIDLILVHQFLLMLVVVNYRMFFGALCADAISTVAEKIRYSVPWAVKSPGVSKSMYLIIQRCQKPLRLSVTGIVPTYSLVYYANFLSSTFSYFLYIKAILEL